MDLKTAKANLCRCTCRCLVLRRHSERSEEPPHLRGERSDPSASLFPTQTNVISTEGGALCRRSGETPHYAFALACSSSNSPQPIKEMRKGTKGNGRARV